MKSIAPLLTTFPNMPPLLWHGEVWHARHTYQSLSEPAKSAENRYKNADTKLNKNPARQISNQFTYPLFFLTLPLGQLPSIANAFLGLEKLRLCSLHVKDHGDRNGTAWLPWIRQLLLDENITAADGEIVLQTFPRVFGYAFNPVSFWFCYDHKNQLRVVLCEVNNTFGDTHNYLVAHPDQRPITSKDELTARKTFHVSPFFPIDGEYRFRFDLTTENRRVVIDYWLDGQCVLQTQITGRPKVLTALSLACTVARQPFITFAVMGHIHWQALRLWLKRAVFHPRPLPSTQKTSR